MNETETLTLTERIIEAIVVHGGIAEDVEYLSNEAVHALGLNLAQAGIKARTPNPAFVVMPLNDLKGNMDNFKWVRNHLAKLKFSIESTDGPKTVELIKCKPGKTEAVLKEIDENGFIPVPSPYVLGLGVQYPDVIKEYGRIISLDEQNVLLRGSCDSCFLYLYWDGLRNLSLTKRTGWWDDRWWFAVVRK